MTKTFKTKYGTIKVTETMIDCGGYLENGISLKVSRYNFGEIPGLSTDDINSIEDAEKLARDYDYNGKL